MTRLFKHTKIFDAQWADIGCSDEDLAEVQRIICLNPDLAPVIRGTGGVRKLRAALEGRGKRGGARVLYADFPEFEVVYLLTAYPKNGKENIDEQERRELKLLMESINRAWRGRK
ncbi:toxin HigB-2 [Clostridia bacterium]|nr:toxin HigB-2 [Clostridia bacterium]